MEKIEKSFYTLLGLLNWLIVLPSLPSVLPPLFADIFNPITGSGLGGLGGLGTFLIYIEKFWGTSEYFYINELEKYSLHPSPPSLQYSH